MPYCSNCRYWLREGKHLLQVIACPNCAHTVHKNDTMQLLMNLGGFVGVFLALGGIAHHIDGKVYGSGMCAFGLGLVGGWVWINVISKTSRKSHQRPPEVIFEELQNQSLALLTDSNHFRDLLKLEQDAPATERGQRRQELLRAALLSRENRFLRVEAELWTRKVQLWLNELEGYLAEDLPRLKRSNGEHLLDVLYYLLDKGRKLQKSCQDLGPLESVSQQAREILSECLTRFPDLEERVRDARVLAAVGSGPDIPEELQPGSTWLHWLQEAIPTIATLPPEFDDDAEYLHVQAELRLLRDGAKYTPSQSLDLPSNRDSAQTSLDPEG